MASDSLYVVRLVFFLILAPFACYCLHTHGKKGLMGWLYLSSFCMLRILTGGIGIGDSGLTLTLTILNSIGVSPLMLCGAGLLHEVRLTCIPGLNKNIELLLDIKYHVVVMGGMAVLITGVLNIEDHPHRNFSTWLTLIKVGSAISFIGWGLLLLWALLTLQRLFNLRGLTSTPLNRCGLTLVYGVLAVIPLLLLRLVYGVASLLLKVQHPNSAFLTSTAAQVIMEILPEILGTAAYIAAGLKTRGLKKVGEEEQKYEVPLQRPYDSNA